MSAHQHGTLDEYLEYLSDQPQEADKLARSLLINVTSFFRDPEAFKSLRANALLPLLHEMNIDTIFRAWVPGCATGEEAISIAIMIYECLRELNMTEMEVRIFATDMNRDLLQIPRAGLYPHSIAGEISPNHLRDHFIEAADGYRVRNHISRMIIWSEHNLVEHPPFSNLHLVSCRNVLIYFQRRLQERMLALFQFALQPGGILFLGSSETLPQQTEAFMVVDSRQKVFRRTTATEAGQWLRLDQPFHVKLPDYNSTETTMADDNPSRRDNKGEDRELTLIRQALMQHYNPTCVIVDEYYRVRYSYGEVDRYLSIVPGREGQNNILDMARQGLDVELTVALHQAVDESETVIRRGVWVKTNGDERIIDLTIKPLADNALSGNNRLVIFEVTADGERLQDSAREDSDGDEGATITRLRDELGQTQQALQNVTQALQAKSEELTTSMEEIHSANEEVQTTNEELRTSKEELESMNEELNTLNAQLSDQNTELSRANDILHNFLQSTEIGAVFLDQDLRIREYTAAVTEIFGLRPGDIGRLLAEIANHLNYDNLMEDAESVLDTLINVQKEVEARDGRWYDVRIRPYRTINNVIDGLELTFSDITAQKTAQANAERQRDYVRQVFDTLEHSLLELDGDLRVVAANQSFYDTFQVRDGNTIGTLLYNLGNGQWNIPDLRRLLTEIIPDRNIVRDYEVTHDFPNLGRRTMRLNARQIAELNRILLVVTDVSEE